MPEVQAIKEVIRSYLVENFLGGENPADLTDQTPLVTGAILDSISTIQLVAFLEEKFNFEFEPSEVDQENLNTISLIANFVQSKLQAST